MCQQPVSRAREDGSPGRGLGMRPGVPPSLIHSLPLPSGCPRFAPENNLPQLSEEPQTWQVLPGPPVWEDDTLRKKANPALHLGLIPLRKCQLPKARPPREPAPSSLSPGPATTSRCVSGREPCVVRLGSDPMGGFQNQRPGPGIEESRLPVSGPLQL